MANSKAQKSYKPLVPLGHENLAPGHYSKQIQYIDGTPHLVAVPIESRIFKQRSAQATLKALMTEALNLPYAGPNPAYHGLTKGEVFIIDLIDQASRGDPQARQEVLDRLLGKPEQKTKSLKVEASLEDFLDAIAQPKPSHTLAGDL